VAFGEPDPAIREIHEIVRLAQQAGMDAVRPGVTGGQVDEAAREVIRDAGYGDAYTHSLGHGVGLEVHEGPRLSKAGDETLVAGNVVTVEPGVYLPGRFGVRVEDLVFVGDDGAEVLSGFTKDLTTIA
jgi:Xaa-Pro aminopeptidase